MARSSTVFFVLLAITMTFAATSQSIGEQAQLRYAQSLDRLNSAVDSISNAVNSNTIVDQATQLSQNIQQQSAISAQNLANILQNLRTTAIARIDSVDALLNSTSTTEKRVVEKGFEVVNTIIDEINAVSNLNITNEYEAADLSAYVEAKIKTANDLLTNLRTYIAKYIDHAVDQVNSVAGYIDEKAGTIKTIAQNGEETMKSIVALLQEIKNSAPSTLLPTSENDLPRITATSEFVSFPTTTAGTTAGTNAGSASLPQSAALSKIQQLLATTNNVVNTVNTVVNNGKRSVDAIASTVRAATEAVKNVKQASKGTINDFKNILKF